MEYRRLGNTGLTVSRICFGALTVGPHQSNLPPDRAGEIIAHALDLGINFIDTAQLYESYAHIAAGLARRPNKDVVICSKTYAYEATAAYEAVEQARTALNRDVIDIFLLHEQESEHTLRGHQSALEMLYRLKSQNVIRAVGLSTHHVAGVTGAVKFGLDVVFPLLNVTGFGIVDGTRLDMETAVQQASGNGLGVFLMKPFGGGNLLSRTQECMEYAFSREYAASVAIGMQSETEVDANVSWLEKGHFPPELYDRLRRTKRRLLVESWCNGCGTCASVCQQNAIAVDPEQNRAVVKPERCLTCGYCGAACPQTCLKII